MVTTDATLAMLTLDSTHFMQEFVHTSANTDADTAPLSAAPETANWSGAKGFTGEEHWKAAATSFIKLKSWIRAYSPVVWGE